MFKWGFAACMALVATVTAAPVEQLWERRYNGQASREDVFSALTVDVGGRVYVTGSSDNNVNPDPYGTVKYDTNGTRLWEARYTGPRAIDVPLSVIVDSQGYVYVTGFSHGFASGYDPDYATIKYAPEGTELWVARYNGAGTNYQSPDNPMAMLVNAAGEVYVTGASMSPQQTLDFATIKYATNGTELWIARYNGAASYSDRATAMGIDGAGNIYVCGSSEREDYKARVTLLKYSPTGTQLWEAHFDTSEEGYELVPLMKVDPSGKAHIAFTTRRGSQQDVKRLIALQYNSEGELVWRGQHRLVNAQYGIDVVAVELDDAGNMCVAVRGVGSSYSDYLVWKVSGAGESLWTSRYNSPWGYQDVVGGMTLDAEGNIYVTGTTYTSGNQYQFTTIKLRPNGQREWEATTEHSNNSGMSLSGVQVDAAGHVYVGGSVGQVGTKDYVTIKYRQLPQPGLPEITAHPVAQSTIEGGSATFSVTATGEGLEYQWRREGFPISDATNSTLSLTNIGGGARGYYYVEVSNSGGTVASTEALLDVILAPQIVEQPVSLQVIAGSAAEFSVMVTGSEPLSFQWLRGGAAITGATNSTLLISNVQPADAASYSVVVTNIAGGATSESATLSLVPGLEQLFVGTFRQSGQGYGSPQSLRVGTDGKAHLAQTLQLPNQSDFLTVQFDTNGAPTWSARYALGTNRANYLAMAEMDASNNVYVAGTGGENFGRWLAVVKYGPAGNQLWAAAHDTTRTNTYDAVAALAVDAAGNVYVTGSTESQQVQRDFLTVKFDANGVEQWAVRYTLSDSSSDAASAIQVDASGVYVFGTSYTDTANLVTIKYDHAGTVLWTRTYDAGSSGQAAAMKLDATGNVIVTGSATPPDSDSDFVTLKYSPGGNVLWIAQFGGMMDGWDYPYALGLDAAGNVYVAGTSSLPNEENTGLSAFSIVKYDASGNQLWVSSEIAAASQGGFAVDAAGSAYRLLGKYHEESGSDFVTSKFDTNGTRLWEATSTRGRYSDEYPGGLALTDGGDLLVSGISYNPVSELLLFRYRQSPIVGLPVITEPPRSRDVIVGASVTFNVTATGTGLSYQWYFNGRAIGGATSPSYTVTSAGERNAGFYAVEVRNAVGSVLSPTAILSIGVPPAITQQPFSQTVLPGADVVFEVFADGSRPLSYRWRHNGTNIPGAFSARLELLNVQLEQGGLYSVVVSNRAGVVTSANALLTVTSQARRDWLALFAQGAPTRSFPVDMELDGAENVYVGGLWEIAGAFSRYLTAKFSSAGEQLWARGFSTNDSAASAAAIAVDVAGNAYTVGDAVISNGVRGVVTVKYDPDGNRLWTRQFVLPGHTLIEQDITLSVGGNIYVAASFIANLSSQRSLVTVGYDTNGVQLWSATHALAGSDWSGECKVAAHSDAEVYAVSHAFDSSTGRDVIAVKYNAAGTEVWNRRVAVLGDQRLAGLKIDSAGDPVVVAHSIGSSTNNGFFTVKLRSTDGETLWRRAFSRLQYENDQPFSLEVDDARNIYVTGKSYVGNYYDEYGNYHQDEDVLTLKYSPAGELLWVATYGAPAGNEDVGRAIAWDGFEGLYITGMTEGQYGNEGWLTLRYDTDGNRYWSDIYNGPYGGQDYGVAVRARSTNAYVVGLTVSDGYERVGLIKYTDTGTTEVPRITTAPQSQTAIAGNNVTLSVVATGPGQLRYQWYHNGSPIIGATGSSVLLPQVETTNAGNYSVEISNAAGVVVSPNALLKIVIPARIVLGPEDQCVVAGSQVQFRALVEGDGEVGINWYFNGAPIPANYYYLTITNATAANAGVYTVVVTNLYGSATASARLTISPQAALAWSARYNNTNNSHDQPEAAVVNSQGNTYILGNNGRGSVLLKYESTGALAWERWNVRTSYIMFATTELALAPDGAVYVAGWVQGPMENEHLLTLVKYSSNGDQLWDAEYSAIGDFPRPVDMKVDAAGNVCITAESGPDRYTPAEILTLKYDADGNRLWVRRLDYSPDGQDLPVALAVDPAGNIYVTGYSVEPDAIEYYQVANYLTVKYNAAGTLLWTAEHSGPGAADDRPSAIAVDAQGNVYVTGSHSAEYWVNSGTTVYFDYDYATIKYDTDGNQAWLAVYHSAPRQPDLAVDLKVDAAGNVYVVGESDGDIVTVKYNAAGEQQWVTGFDSGFDYDVASRLVLDDLGNAYITGHSGDYGDILTCKLDANGSRIWVARFDGRQPAHGSGGSHDYPIAIGLDAARNVYVAGSVDSPITSRDFIVFRYTAINSPGSPVITVPPQDTTVNFGATASFSVTATGDAPLRYQWRRNGIGLANETNATVQIPEVTFTDAGQYSVVVYNNIDFTVSAEAALTVTMPEMVQCVHVEQTGNGVRLIVAGPAACTYRVECTADFVAWQALGTVYNHNGTCEYLDTTPASQRRFYRVVKLPN
jgi:uncharacterized delta-60 repeat protein